MWKMKWNWIAWSVLRNQSLQMGEQIALTGFNTEFLFSLLSILEMTDLGNSTPAPPAEEVMKENEGTILKPKRVRRMTDEARALAAERMRKVNQERIDKSRIRREQEFAETEAKLKKKLEDVAAMKASIGVIKTKSKKIPPPQPPEAPAGAEIKAPKAPKKVVIKKPVVEESDEDSVDYGAKSDEESEEEVVYVAKKKAPKKEKTLLKERKSSTPAAAPAASAPAQSVYRFI